MKVMHFTTLLMVIFLLILSNAFGVVAQENITGCQDLNQNHTVYVLQNDIDTEAKWQGHYEWSCFFVPSTNVNITLNCQNYSIIGNTSSDAIVVSANDVTILNCVIENVSRGFNTGGPITGLNFTRNNIKDWTMQAMNFKNVNDSFVEGNSFDASNEDKNAIETGYAYRNTFAHNEFYNLNNYSYFMILVGADSEDSNYNTIDSNIFNITKVGVKLDTASNNNISNNIFGDNVTRSIELTDNSQNNLVFGNLLRHNETVLDNGVTNYWNLSESNGGGNNWTGYEDVNFTCTDVNMTGFCDQPFTLKGNANSKDYLPYFTPTAGMSETIIDLLKILINPSIENILIGNVLEFLINVTNLNDSTVTGLTLLDEYNTTFLNYTSASTPPTYINQTTGEIEWDIPNLTNGSSFEVLVNFTAISNGTTNNTAFIEDESETEIEFDDVEFNISNTGPNVTLVATQISENPININDKVEFLLNLTNYDGSAITGYFLFDSVNHTFLNYSGEAKPQPDEENYGLEYPTTTELGWNITNLLDGDSFEVYVNFTARSNGTTSNNVYFEDEMQTYEEEHVLLNITDDSYEQNYMIIFSNQTNSNVTATSNTNVTFIILANHTTKGFYTYNFSLESTGAISLWINGSTQITNLSLQENETAVLNVTASSAVDGIYNISIIAVKYDNSTILFNSSDDLTITLNVNTPDVTNPIWTQEPSNFSVNEGTQINVDYNATDNVAIDTYSVNDTTNFAINTTGHLTNATTLTPGTYSLLISVNDTTNNTISQAIVVTILDITGPTWNETPSNFNVNEKSDLIMQFNATDNVAIDTYSVNDTTNFAINTTGHLTNATTLTPGNYSINISVNDTSGYGISAAIIVTIKDITPPQISNVSNSSIGNNSVLINWITNELASSQVNYGVNETYSEVLNSGTLVLNHSIWLTNLTNNTIYSYFVTSCDADMNCNSASSNFTTLQNPDVVNPVWTQIPYNVSFNNMTTISIQYNATDDWNIDTYFVNDTGNFSMNSTGYLTNATELLVGNYSLNVSVNDTSGNTIFQIINVEITEYDITLPIWTQEPSNFSVNEGTQINVDYNATDNVAIDTYSVNDTTNFAINTTGHLTNATTLAIGKYTVLLSVNDTMNNILASVIVITINDATNPSINLTSPINYTYNESVIPLVFNPSDNIDIDICWFNLNGTMNITNATVNCSNATNTTTSLYLINGSYSLTVYTNDTTNNIFSTSTEFTINDTTAPNMTSPLPTGVQTSATTSVTLSITTDENATCKYSTTDINYTNMSSNLTSHTTTHTSSYTVSADKTYTFYVRCKDLSGNENNASSIISFSVAAVSSSGNNNNRGSSGSSFSPDNEEKEENETQEVVKKEKKQINETQPKEQRKEFVQSEPTSMNNNSVLQKTLAEILGKDNLDENTKNIFRENAVRVKELVKMNRVHKLEQNKTKIVLSLKNTGNETIKNFAIFDIVPKEFAEFASRIIVNAPGATIIVINEDPEYLIVYPELRPGEEVSFSYEINESRDENIIDAFSTEIYTQEKPVIIEEKKTTTNTVGIMIVLIILIAVLIYVFFIHKGPRDGSTNHSKYTPEEYKKSLDERLKEL